MKGYRIFCDAYGSYVTSAECRKCMLKNDCVKVELPMLKIKLFKVHKYPEQSTRLLKSTKQNEL